MHPQTKLTKSVLCFRVKNWTVLVERTVSSSMHHARVEIDAFFPKAVNRLLTEARHKQELRKIANDALGNELPSLGKLPASARKVVYINYCSFPKLIRNLVKQEPIIAVDQ